MTAHYTPEFLEHARKVLSTELTPPPPFITGGYIPDRPLPWTSPEPKFVTQELLDMAKLLEETPEIMFDLETLHLGPRACIVSLGAVAFNVRHCSSVSDFKSPVGEAWGLGARSFYRVLDLPIQQSKGRVIDADTVKWWMTQGDAAKKVFAVEPWSPYGVLESFRAWVLRQGGKRLWANPTTFDVPKLESIFEDFGCRLPFTYRDYRDLKTLKAVTRPLDKADYADLVSHHALDDAIYQALEVQRVYRYNPELRAESDSDGAKQNGG